MFGFYKFENYYFGEISRINPSFDEWAHIKDVKIGDKEIKMGTNYSYPTLLLRKNDKKYIDLFHQGRIILIKRKKNERCYVVDFVEAVGNYFPQDMLINKKYLTKQQAIECFGNYLMEFDRNNSKKDEVKILVYSKKED